MDRPYLASVARRARSVGGRFGPVGWPVYTNLASWRCGTGRERGGYGIMWGHMSESRELGPKPSRRGFMSTAGAIAVGAMGIAGATSLQATAAWMTPPWLV